mmetsp:Transcript_8052/g.18829  ORF Transcript_8052/g.18829 Transcript_8052/m.18829 type:complete len:81 (+) Transcript_8052:924-1166(+)
MAQKYQALLVDLSVLVKDLGQRGGAKVLGRQPEAVAAAGAVVEEEVVAADAVEEDNKSDGPTMYRRVAQGQVVGDLLHAP